MITNLSFKHSLFGYKPEIVEEKIDLVNSEYESTINELNNEYGALVHDVQEIKDRIGVAKKQISEYNSIENEIAKVLLTAHLEASQKVYRALNKAREIEESKKEMALMVENKLVALQDTLKKYIDEIQVITER